MKKITTTCTWILLTATTLVAQHRDTVTEEIAFEQQNDKNVFYLANINGEITVEAHDGDKVILEAKREVSAKTDTRLERALKELSLGFIDRLDTIIVYIKGPCAQFSRGNYRYKKSKSGWCYNWDDCKDEYDFKLDFTLKIPRKMNVYLSTVNKGDIKINDIQGDISAHNINGSITIKGVESPVYAYTINGDVDIDYASLVGLGNSYFYTLNGDIVANYPRGLKADLSFKSYNGDFYTNIDEIEYKANVVKKQEGHSGSGVSFKVDTKSLISVRGGGAMLDFETFNGDVYVKENK